MRVELGNTAPQEKTYDGNMVPAAHGQPCVTYVQIPDYPDAFGNPLYTFPDDEVHDDASLPHELASVLRGMNSSDDHTRTVRRALIDGMFAHASGVKGLPDHSAFVAIVHPQGLWNIHAVPGTDPEWVWSDHPGLQHMLALYFGCREGRPADLEHRFYTQYGPNSYPPGKAPEVADVAEMLHTSWGRDSQSIKMGGTGYVGISGVGTAATATTLTSAAVTSQTANAMAGQYIFAGPNTSGAGSTVYGLIVSHTSGTTPVFTVDQWYAAATPGGAAGTTPNATASYLVPTGGPPAQFVALSTDTTAKSLGGTGGTADAASITQTLTSEITTASGGLIRKIGVMAHSAGTSTWTNTPVFTANGSDSLPVTVGTAALSPTIKSGTGALEYLTLVSPTATLSASGDQLTLTWTFTMT